MVRVARPAVIIHNFSYLGNELSPAFCFCLAVNSFLQFCIISFFIRFSILFVWIIVHVMYSLVWPSALKVLHHNSSSTDSQGHGAYLIPYKNNVFSTTYNIIHFV